MKDGLVVGINNPNEFFENMSDYQNLMFNLMSGLDVESLSDEEILILQSELGEDWKKELGYEQI